MAFNGSGTFSRPVSSYVFDTVISETDMNSEMDGIATGLSSVIAKDGQTTTTARIPFASGIYSDTIAELTSATGVTVDGALLKDGRIDTTQGADIASASTVNLETATGNVVDVTGTTTITAITLSQGHWRWVRFTGILTLTHGASLVLPGAANITTAAGDYALFMGYASSVVRCAGYIRAAGVPLTDPMTTRGDVIVRNSSNVTARLAVGAAGTALVSDGTDVAYAGIIKQGTHTIFVPAGAMRPTTSNGCAALAAVETTAGRPDLIGNAYDATADEHAQFQVSFPKSWDEGTVTFRVWWWSTAADTDGVAWGLQGVACSDGDTADVAYGTPVVVTDAAQSTTEDVYVTDISSAVTIAGTPAAGDICFFRLFRDVSDAADTAAEDCICLGVQILYTVNSADDA